MRLAPCDRAGGLRRSLGEPTEVCPLSGGAPPHRRAWRPVCGLGRNHAPGRHHRWLVGRQTGASPLYGGLGGPETLRDIGPCLDLFPVLAFVTDRCNRIVRVNHTFARTIGDPVRDRLPPAARFVPAMVAGPISRRSTLASACNPGPGSRLPSPAPGLSSPT